MPPTRTPARVMVAVNVTASPGRMLVRSALTATVAIKSLPCQLWQPLACIPRLCAPARAVIPRIVHDHLGSRSARLIQCLGVGSDYCARRRHAQDVIGLEVKEGSVGVGHRGHQGCRVGGGAPAFAAPSGGGRRRTGGVPREKTKD